MGRLANRHRTSRSLALPSSGGRVSVGGASCDFDPSGGIRCEFKRGQGSDHKLEPGCYVNVGEGRWHCPGVPQLHGRPVRQVNGLNSDSKTGQSWASVGGVTVPAFPVSVGARRAKRSNMFGKKKRRNRGRRRKVSPAHVNPSIPTGLPRGRLHNPSIGTGLGLGRYQNPHQSDACKACSMCGGVCTYDPFEKKVNCSGYSSAQCLQAAMEILSKQRGTPAAPGGGLRGRRRGRKRGRFASVAARRANQDSTIPRPKGPGRLTARPGPGPDPGRCCVDEATGRVQCPNGKADWQAHGEILPAGTYGCYDGPNGERLCSISLGDAHFSIPACPTSTPPNGKTPPGECCFNVNTGMLECAGAAPIPVEIVTEFEYPDGRPGVSVSSPQLPGGGMRVPLCDKPPTPGPECCVVQHEDGRYTLQCNPDPHGWNGLDVTAFTKCYGAQGCAVEFTDPAGNQVTLEIPLCKPPPDKKPPPDCCVDASTTPPTLQKCSDPAYNGTPVQIVDVDEATGTVMVGGVPWSSALVRLPLCPEPPDIEIPPPNGCPPGYVRDPVTGDCCPPPRDCPPPPECPPPEECPPWTFPCPDGYLLDQWGNCVQCPPPQDCPPCPPPTDCPPCPPPQDCPPCPPQEPCPPPGRLPPPGPTPCGDVPCPVPPNYPPPPGGHLPPECCPDGGPCPVPAQPYPPPPGGHLPPACCEAGAMGLPCPHQ